MLMLDNAEAVEEFNRLQLSYGSRVRVLVRLERARSYNNPGSPDFNDYLERSGYDLKGVIKSPLLVERAGSRAVPTLLDLLYKARLDFLNSIDRHFEPRDGRHAQGHARRQQALPRPASERASQRRRDIPRAFDFGHARGHNRLGVVGRAVKAATAARAAARPGDSRAVGLRRYGGACAPGDAGDGDDNRGACGAAHFSPRRFDQHRCARRFHHACPETGSGGRSCVPAQLHRRGRHSRARPAL